MANYIDYIKDSSASIIKLTESEEKTTLRDIYQNLKESEKVLKVGGEVSQKVTSEFWNKAITRKDVREAFRKDVYEGFVAAMLWGGLGSNGRSFNHLEKALDKSKQAEVTKKLNAVKDLVAKGDIENAFSSMCPGGDNKIDGVDVSYFTKILFFLSDISDCSKVIPLIYDNWGWHIHAAILLSLKQKDKVIEYFIIYSSLKKERNKITINPKVALPDTSTSRRTKAYLDYIQLMHDQSQEISKALSPGNLEQYLFGKSRKDEKAKTIDNPRVVLVNYLTEELAKMFKEAEIKVTVVSIEDDMQEALSLTKNGEILRVQERTATKGYCVSIGDYPNLVLFIGREGKHRGVKLPYYCELIIDAKEGELNKILEPVLYKDLSSVFDYIPKGTGKYIYSTKEKTFDEAKVVFEKALNVLKLHGTTWRDYKVIV